MSHFSGPPRLGYSPQRRPYHDSFLHSPRQHLLRLHRRFQPAYSPQHNRSVSLIHTLNWLHDPAAYPGPSASEMPILPWQIRIFD